MGTMHVVFLSDYEWLLSPQRFPIHVSVAVKYLYLFQHTHRVSQDEVVMAHERVMSRLCELLAQEPVLIFTFGHRSLACLYGKEPPHIMSVGNIKRHSLHLFGMPANVWSVDLGDYKNPNNPVYVRATAREVARMITVYVSDEQTNISHQTIDVSFTRNAMLHPTSAVSRSMNVREPFWLFDMASIQDRVVLWGFDSSGQRTHYTIDECQVSIVVQGATLQTLASFASQHDLIAHGPTNITAQPFELYQQPTQMIRFATPVSMVSAWRHKVQLKQKQWRLYDAHLPIPQLVARQYGLHVATWSDELDRPRPTLEIAAIDVEFSGPEQIVTAWTLLREPSKSGHSACMPASVLALLGQKEQHATEIRQAEYDVLIALYNHLHDQPIDVLVAYRFAQSVIPLVSRLCAYGIPTPFSRLPLYYYWAAAVPAEHGSVGGLGCFTGVLTIDLAVWAYTRKIVAEPTLQGLCDHFGVAYADADRAGAALQLCIKQAIHWSIIEHARVFGICPPQQEAYGKMRQTDALFYAHARNQSIVFPARSYTNADEDAKATSKTFKGALNIQKPGLYASVVQLDAKHYYPSIIIGHNICVTRCVRRHAQDNPATFAWCNDTRGYQRGELGFIPTVCVYLLEKRASVQQRRRALLKQDASADCSVLDQEEMAFKLSANVVYGCLPDKVLSEDVAAIARDILLQSIDYCNQHMGTVIAADTDSVMVHVPSVPEGTDGFSVIQTAFEQLNERVGPEIGFKYEGTASRILLQTSKRRAFVMAHAPKQVIMKGLEATQLGVPPIVRTTLTRLIHDLLLSPSFPTSSDLLVHSLGDAGLQIVNGTLHPKQFVIYERLKSPTTKPYALYKELMARHHPDIPFLPGHIGYIEVIDVFRGERTIRPPSEVVTSHDPSVVRRHFLIDRFRCLTQLWKPAMTLLTTVNPEWGARLDHAHALVLQSLQLIPVPFSNQLSELTRPVYICPMCATLLTAVEHQCNQA